MTNRHAIIAGANKCGTTSLFRYLADHPQVCPSNVKETRYFLGPESDGSKRSFSGFSALFSPRGQEAVMLEATPGYLVGGQRIARRIATVVPDAKLMFLLRHPADRLLSYFRSQETLPESPCHGLHIDDFVQHVLEAVAQDKAASGGKAPFLREMQMGRYAVLLEEFLHVFPPAQVRIMFFEQLAQSPLSVTQQAARFLDIDASYYDAYDFTVENRSRTHRNSRLRDLAGQLNRVAEPVLNRAPALRHFLRRTYNFVNVDPQRASPAMSDARRLLSDLYKEDNARLRVLILDRWPETLLPGWLT